MSLDHLMQQAVTYFHNGDHEQSERLLKKILQIQPKTPDALLMFGVICGLSGRQQEAIKVLKRACKISQQNNYIHFNLAKALADSENDKESIQHHQRATSLAPNHKEAWLNYGKSLSKLNKDEEAIHCYKKALEIDEKYAEALANMGCSFQAIHRYEDAISAIEKAININPNMSEAWRNKGQAFYGLEKFKDAIECYEISISLEPNYAIAWSDKGFALNKLKNYDNALSCFDIALSIKPKLYKAWIGKGEVLNRLKKYEAALVTYDSAIEIDSEAFEARCDKGITYNKLKRFEDALKQFEQALKLKTSASVIWMHKGLALAGLKKWDESLGCLEKAIEIEPNYYEAWSNMGLILMDSGMEDKAFQSYQKALAINPSGCEVNNNLGGYYLGKFIYDKGWQANEYRFECLGLDQRESETKMKWDGAPKNNRLFIWGEQGVGDQILYASMFKEIEKYPQQVTVSTDKRLITIFERSFPKIQFIDKEAVYGDEHFDEHISMGSLGQFLRKDIQDFKVNSSPYLIDDPDKSSNFRKMQTTDSELMCGISWRSSNNKHSDEKSIPIERFMEVLQVDKLKSVNLQYGDISGDIELIKSTTGISPLVVDEVDPFSDLDGLLSLINACDVVVTISNVTAHLAGSIGKETLLLLPYTIGKFWYWSNYNGHSLCYPSVKIFQQEKQGCWDAPIQEIKKYLQNRIESKNQNKLI